ncbi:UDP-N-acetylglucosamine 2-epimerase (hydrolyzing) [Clostridium botulinum]|nr:UDP-N-acetylglucosamine 2-epimerase (hydrolyzing) [Clostridium botulinum]NFS95617.1 UDP-N-acetylglucosamine 2-epimerase (hydrolyzing) [Clostridium botulinum]
MKKILALTGIRSDYDLLSNLYRKINEDRDFELKFLVSGAHLSQTYGHTVDLIEKDGFEILLKIETLIDSDSKSGRLKTTAILLQTSIDIVKQYNPDLIIYAGDREEVIVGSMLGTFLGIPTAHFFGGEYTASGHIDNQLRYAAAKMSSISFVSTEEQKCRLKKMGEAEERIFCIGDPSLDKFLIEEYVDMNIVFKKLKVNPMKKYALVIYHAMDESNKYTSCFENILTILKEKDIPAFISYPNTDPGNRKIIDVIEKYKNVDKFYFYKNLERNTFINIYRNAYFQIGNSSAGIVESASLHIPVIDVGDRQKGRLSSGNVINSKIDHQSIKESIEKAISKEFIKNCRKINNIYGDGRSSEKALKLLKKLEYKKYLLKMEDPYEF